MKPEQRSAQTLPAAGVELQTEKYLRYDDCLLLINFAGCIDDVAID
ncbi:hypothetical protein [Undibacterium oligocarboniphilum]|uniref:Uncharacterized protein n=1 Tax=Undibacterium oligocarboniphilum TaxID=666702 RepID=A0A850QLG5_9BURK|nr:hypothetical protein [Undibacterium oligocarboniphilum]NVO77560.1 hypothetical protein [Undibacterium oligocarboniphilum]